MDSFLLERILRYYAKSLSDMCQYTLQAILLLHVVGNYGEALHYFFQHNVANIYLVEDIPESFGDNFIRSSKLPFSDMQLFLYSQSPKAFENPSVGLLPNGMSYFKFSGVIDSPTSKISQSLRDYLQQAIKENSKPCLPINLLVQHMPNVSAETHVNFKLRQEVQGSVDNAMKITTVASLRASFYMQHSFFNEAKAELEANESVIRNMDTAIAKTLAVHEHYKQVHTRQKLAAGKLIEGIPVLKLFLPQIASLHAQQRVAFVVCLDNAIRAAIRPVLDEILGQMRTLKDEGDGKRRHRLEKNFCQTTCHLEHIWREISHLYVANTKKFELLPFNASQHLLDGFPLELMDGDAGLINTPWVLSVLLCLHDSLEEQNGKAPRIFVLSILGVQSSGKSTLLNAMFGCRFRVSVGKCTRGINMSLIPVEGWSGKYDYIMLLDTEGIQSDELTYSKTHDNRLAALSLWPADATIVMLAGEDSRTLHNVLPVVGEAYHHASLAKVHGVQLPAQLFFAQRGVNAAATDNAGCEQGIKHHWNTQLATNLKVACVDGMLRQYNQDTDYVFLGNNREGSLPRDTPNPEYGACLLKFREAIERRVAGSAEWNARTIRVWAAFLRDLWPAIRATNLALSWDSLTQKQDHEDIENEMEIHVCTITINWH